MHTSRYLNFYSLVALAADFRHLLQKPVGSAKKPKPFPVGTYTGKIDKYELGESSEKKTPYCRLFVTPLAAGEGVDQGQLATSEIELGKRQIRKDYYLTDDALWRFQ